MGELTIIEFLRARLDEDERAARAEVRLQEQVFPNGEFTTRYEWARLTEHRTSGGTGMASVPGAPTPHQVLQWAGALRRIVELHTPTEVPEHAPADCPTCARWEFDVAMGDDSASPVHYPCPTLRVLALPYSHHPDYREEWAP